MEKFRKAIKRTKRFETSYYDDLIDVIDRYIEQKPDVSIETGKAILEGTSKLVLGVLRQTPSSSFKDKTVAQIFKEARVCLSEEIERSPKAVNFDDEFVSKFGGVANVLGQVYHSEIIAHIGTLRNDHGDICHGRSSKKDQINDLEIAEFIIGIVDNISTYLLITLDKLADYEPIYEDYSDFNDWLDRDFQLLLEDKSIDIGIKYSKALYDQKSDLYWEQYNTYLTLQEDFANENGPWDSG